MKKPSTRPSELSIEAFERYGVVELRKKAQKVLREIDTIKDQIYALGLEDHRNVSIYYGNSREIMKHAGEAKAQVDAALATLRQGVEQIVSVINEPGDETSKTLK